MDLVKRFKDEFGHEMTNEQQEIVRRIVENIHNGNRMQTILLPNGAGKTTLAFLLSMIFSEEGKRVLYYVNEKYLSKNAARYIKTRTDNEKTFDIGCCSNMTELKDNHYDFIITDSVKGIFDLHDSAHVLEDFYNEIKNVDIQEANNTERTTSTTKKVLAALHCVQEIAERDNSFVISFELTHLKNAGYAPIISAPNVLTYSSVPEEKLKYAYSCIDEFEEVNRRRRKAIEEKMPAEKAALEYSEVGQLLLHKFDQLSMDINLKMDGLNTKVDSIQDDVASVRATIESLNDVVQSNKDILDLYFSIHCEDDIESERFVTKLFDKITKSFDDKQVEIERQNLYRTIKNMVRIRLGDDVLHKLNEESYKFLITAKYIYLENVELENDVDYSSVCILASKALEVELAKRLVNSYEQYLDDYNISEDCWPKSILVRDRETNRYVRMSAENYTLGSSPYIMGIKGNDPDKTLSSQYFIKYCKERLLSTYSAEEIDAKIEQYNGYISEIINKYRNPAAHKKSMNLITAGECLDYILEVTRVLKIMLEDFSF